MSDLTDAELVASIQSEEQFAALDSDTRQRVLKRERGDMSASAQASAQFDDANQS